MGIIQCGSFVGNTTVTIGWEPQYIMIKRTDSPGDWITIDSMRGCSVGGIDAILNPNLSSAENISNDYIDFTPTGFISKNLTGTYIYMVIRRPMKVPTSGTEVFAVDTDRSIGTTSSPSFYSGFVTDLTIGRATSIDNSVVADRLRGGKILYTDDTSAESSNASYKFDYMTGAHNFTSAYSPMAYLLFKRAPKFMDIVCYTGTGVARTVPHGLGVVPELMIVKNRYSSGMYWAVYYGDPNSLLQLNESATPIAAFSWNSTAPTSTVFSLGTQGQVNRLPETYVAYLFATLAGVSKVGSYTGNGSSQTINCGFSAGSRFILIKRTDSTGDWFIWDTARGIVAANDPHLSLNTTAAEVTTDDSIDPASSGFIVNQVAATNINVNGASYIFLAIA